MTDVATRTGNLTRDSGGARTADHPALAVPTQTIFGFPGPKGAGKTTTIRSG